MNIKNPDLHNWIQRYFQDYLVRQRNVSPATVVAYRDTFKILLRFLRKNRRRNPDTLSLEILTPETVLAFLHHPRQRHPHSKRPPGSTTFVRPLPRRLVGAGTAGLHTAHFGHPF